MEMMIGVHTTILPQFGRGFSRYRPPSGLPVVLVIDPTRDLYGVDTDGALYSYTTPSGLPVTLVIDAVLDNYAIDLRGWTYNRATPSNLPLALVIDPVEGVYGAAT
jgi:hypothetical protein